MKLVILGNDIINFPITFTTFVVPKQIKLVFAKIGMARPVR